MKTRIALLVATALLLGGCRNAYYKTWEKLGWEKRHILVDRIEDARDEQAQAKEEFQTTYQRFVELTGFQGGNLEKKYNQLSDAYESCRDQAAAVRKRVAAVDQVAQDMFREWEGELSGYENAELRRASEQQLRETRDRYGQVIAAMRASESKMDPVLRAFNDQVLFLKHNLNAQAIASLQSTAAGIEQDVQRLIADMQASIDQANAFINQMKQTQ
jgi:ElaB/YqjD/DUF883 family membrane-anchored ribosome-binding protein